MAGAFHRKQQVKDVILYQHHKTHGANVKDEELRPALKKLDLARWLACGRVMPVLAGRTMRSMRKQSLIAGAVAYIGMAPLAGHAQTPAQKDPAPTSEVLEASPRGEFRETFAALDKAVEQVKQEVDDTAKKLHAMAGASVESRKAVIKGLRQRLVQLGASLQPDAPFAQSVEKYESWVSAQLARINNDRATLGPEFVDQMITRYRRNQADVSKARELLNTQVKSINASLQELARAETRTAEMVLADDADDASRQLTTTVENIAKTIDAVRAQVRAIGSPGA